jgi:hypothetical protein
MKHSIFKTTAVSALCLAAVGFSGISWGHTVDAGQSLGASSILNVDVYSVTCYTGGTSGLPPLRIVGQATKNGAAEATAKLRISLGEVSTVGTGASATSPAVTAGSATGWAKLAASNGKTYVAVIGHDKLVANPYTADLHCESVAVGNATAPGTASIESGTTIAGGTSSGGGAPIVNQ